ncbi:MAG: flavodoxin, partial [Oscillospiraceae bacterium]|nr:flavodoxin [Oscillospiraceae bacterium]
NTFLESYDLTGKTIILFATSGGSGFDKTAEKLADSCNGAVIKGEKLLNGKVDKDMLSGWIKEICV